MKRLNIFRLMMKGLLLMCLILLAVFSVPKVSGNQESNQKCSKASLNDCSKMPKSQPEKIDENDNQRCYQSPFLNNKIDCLSFYQFEDQALYCTSQSDCFSLLPEYVPVEAAPWCSRDNCLSELSITFIPIR